MQEERYSPVATLLSAPFSLSLSRPPCAVGVEGKVCSSHGACVAGECRCFQGFSGPGCGVKHGCLGNTSYSNSNPRHPTLTPTLCAGHPHLGPAAPDPPKPQSQSRSRSQSQL